MPFIITNGSAYCHKTRTQAVEIVNDSASATRFSTRLSAQKLLQRATKKLKGFEIRELNSGSAASSSPAPAQAEKPAAAEEKDGARKSSRESASQDKRRRGRPKKAASVPDPEVNQVSSAADDTDSKDSQASPSAASPEKEAAEKAGTEKAGAEKAGVMSDAAANEQSSEKKNNQTKKGGRNQDRRKKTRQRQSVPTEETAVLPEEMSGEKSVPSEAKPVHSDEQVAASSAPAAKQDPAPSAPEAKQDAVPSERAPKQDTVSSGPASKQDTVSSGPAAKQDTVSSGPAPKQNTVSSGPAPKQNTVSSGPAPKQNTALAPVKRQMPALRDIQAASASLWADEVIVQPSVRKNGRPEAEKSAASGQKTADAPAKTVSAARETPAAPASVVKEVPEVSSSAVQEFPAAAVQENETPAVPAPAAEKVPAAPQAAPIQEAPAKAEEGNSFQETDRRSNRKQRNNNRRNQSTKTVPASQGSYIPESAEDIFPGKPVNQEPAPTVSREGTDRNQGTGKVRTSGKRIGKVTGNIRSSKTDNDSSQSKRRFFTTKERNLIYNRSEGHCGICGRFIPLEEYTIDHIIPLSKGGTNDLDNLQACCSFCNKAKDDSMGEDFFNRIERIFLYQAKLRYGKKQFKQLKKTLKDLDEN